MKEKRFNMPRPLSPFLLVLWFGSAKLRAPEKAVEAVVTALLSSAQKTKAAVALLSGAAEETAPTA